MLKSLITAFAMYSKIPVPRVEWEEDSMKYAMCFFPLVGVVTGAALYFAGGFMLDCGVNTLLLSAVMSVIPIIITGGIHMDGFIDTADALSSYGSRERRLEIMKDSHTGAFALIWTAVYFILYAGLWSAAEKSSLAMIAAGCVISRSLSGLSIVSFKPAKKDGLARTFSDAAHKKRVIAVLALWLAAAAALLFALGVKYAAAAAAAAGAVFLWHTYNCRRNFGGITGDLAGCFLQLCELAVLAAAIIIQSL